MFVYIPVCRDTTPHILTISTDVSERLGASISRYTLTLFLRFSYWGMIKSVARGEFLLLYFYSVVHLCCQSQWPRGLRRRSAAARLLRSWVRIPPGAWMFVYCQCRVLSDRGLCDELITLPAESYRLCCVVVCDLETSRTRRPWPALGRSAT